MVLSPDGRYAYVSEEPRSFGSEAMVAVIDTATATVTTRIAVKTNASRLAPLAISPDGSRLYAGARDELLVIDIESQRVAESIDFLVFEEGELLVSRDGRRLYNTSKSYVAMYDTVTRQEIAADIDLGVEDELISDAIITADGGRLYVAVSDFGQTAAAIVVLDAATLAEVQRLPCAVGWTLLAGAPDGRFVYSAQPDYPRSPATRFRCHERFRHPVAGGGGRDRRPGGFTEWPIPFHPARRRTRSRCFAQSDHSVR